jgi:DNA replication licensing factor MCM4
VHNLAKVTRMRDLNPLDIDTLVSLRGMVIRTSPVIPDMRRAYFRCTACGAGTEKDIDNGKITEPGACDDCNAKHTLEIVHNRCLFMDKQYIKLQETPESIPEGETPHTVLLYAYEELVDSVVPGDRVQVWCCWR